MDLFFLIIDRILMKSLQKLRESKGSEEHTLRKDEVKKFTKKICWNLESYSHFFETTENPYYKAYVWSLFSQIKIFEKFFIT